MTELDVDLCVIGAGSAGLSATSLAAAKAAHAIRSAGRFVEPRVLQAGDTRIKARRDVIATGSSAAVPKIGGLDGVPYFTNESIFAPAGRGRSQHPRRFARPGEGRCRAHQGRHRRRRQAAHERLGLLRDRSRSRQGAALHPHRRLPRRHRCSQRIDRSVLEDRLRAEALVTGGGMSLYPAFRDNG